MKLKVINTIFACVALAIISSASPVPARSPSTFKFSSSPNGSNIRGNVAAVVVTTTTTVPEATPSPNPIQGLAPRNSGAARSTTGVGSTATASSLLNIATARTLRFQYIDYATSGIARRMLQIVHPEEAQGKAGAVEARVCRWGCF
ncbi:hypothetical protein K435DRAFT_789197 [Dendrothele bispora CBS 962.96]|uniref:Uncharacterized protein n=1 Tax=Dendrothele bispora (strain CBS 962.96) TaxID=1314807 RepID=A0A4S8MU06_DENBC|nr:hypothetical protein K435DRAFT_789197 [Dendrothele bispora CBS 962.96]